MRRKGLGMQQRLTGDVSQNISHEARYLRRFSAGSPIRGKKISLVATAFILVAIASMDVEGTFNRYGMEGPEFVGADNMEELGGPDDPFGEYGEWQDAPSDDDRHELDDHWDHLEDVFQENEGSIAEDWHGTPDSEPCTDDDSVCDPQPVHGQPPADDPDAWPTHVSGPSGDWLRARVQDSWSIVKNLTAFDAFAKPGKSRCRKMNKARREDQQEHDELLRAAQASPEKMICKKFVGPVPHYVFKTDAGELGYHRDHGHITLTPARPRPPRQHHWERGRPPCGRVAAHRGQFGPVEQ